MIGPLPPCGHKRLQDCPLEPDDWRQVLDAYLAFLHQCRAIAARAHERVNKSPRPHSRGETGGHMDGTDSTTSTQQDPEQTVTTEASSQDGTASAAASVSTSEGNDTPDDTEDGGSSDE